jgi:hypothetical protein
VLDLGAAQAGLVFADKFDMLRKRYLLAFGAALLAAAVFLDWTVVSLMDFAGSEKSGWYRGSCIWLVGKFLALGFGIDIHHPKDQDQIELAGAIMATLVRLTGPLLAISVFLIASGRWNWRSFRWGVLAAVLWTVGNPIFADLVHHTFLHLSAFGIETTMVFLFLPLAIRIAAPGSFARRRHGSA